MSTSTFVFAPFVPPSTSLHSWEDTSASTSVWWVELGLSPLGLGLALRLGLGLWLMSGLGLVSC